MQTISTYIIMAGKFDYYKLRKFHKEIFGTDDFCSHYELLFMAEAPQRISGINIWDYVEYIDMKDICKGQDRKLTREDSDGYPYYEIFLLNMWKREDVPPSVFYEIPNSKFLRCIEGKHRMRVYHLLYNADNKLFERVVGKVPGIVVREYETRDVKKEPTKYGEFLNWIKQASRREEAMMLRKMYQQQFIDKEK